MNDSGMTKLLSGGKLWRGCGIYGIPEQVPNLLRITLAPAVLDDAGGPPDAAGARKTALKASVLRLVSQDARQPSPRTALPPRESVWPDWPLVHVTLVTSYRVNSERWPARTKTCYLLFLQSVKR